MAHPLDMAGFPGVAAGQQLAANHQAQGQQGAGADAAAGQPGAVADAAAGQPGVGAPPQPLAAPQPPAGNAGHVAGQQAPGAGQQQPLPHAQWPQDVQEFVTDCARMTEADTLIHITGKVFRADWDRNLYYKMGPYAFAFQMHLRGVDGMSVAFGAAFENATKCYGQVNPNLLPDLRANAQLDVCRRALMATRVGHSRHEIEMVALMVVYTIAATRAGKNGQPIITLSTSWIALREELDKELSLGPFVLWAAAVLFGDPDTPASQANLCDDKPLPTPTYNDYTKELAAQRSGPRRGQGATARASGGSPRSARKEQGSIAGKRTKNFRRN
jgi:hypothetical protein